MTPTVTTDHANATCVVAAEYDADPDRVWRLWSDPRQLERWWGPPTYPATVTDHDLTAGGIDGDHRSRRPRPVTHDDHHALRDVGGPGKGAGHGHE